MKLRLGLGLSLASSTIHALSSLPSRASNKLIPRLSRGFNSATFLTKGMGMGLVGLTLFAAAGPAAAHSEVQKQKKVQVEERCCQIAKCQPGRIPGSWGCDACLLGCDDSPDS